MWLLYHPDLATITTRCMCTMHAQALPLDKDRRELIRANTQMLIIQYDSQRRDRITLYSSSQLNTLSQAH